MRYNSSQYTVKSNKENSMGTPDPFGTTAPPADDPFAGTAPQPEAVPTPEQVPGQTGLDDVGVATDGSGATGQPVTNDQGETSGDVADRLSATAAEHGANFPGAGQPAPAIPEPAAAPDDWAVDPATGQPAPEYAPPAADVPLPDPANDVPPAPEPTPVPAEPVAETPAPAEEKAESSPKDLREYTVIQEHTVEDLVRLHSEGKVKGNAKVNLDLGNTDSRNRKDAVKKYLRENKVETSEGDTFRCEPSKSWGTPLVLKKQEHTTVRTTVDLV